MVRAITSIENALLVIMLAAMVSLAAAQILLRNFFNYSIFGADQLLRLLVLWVALLGAVAASREDKHISVDLFSRLFSTRARSAVRVILDLFTISVCLLLAWHAGRFVASERAAEAVFTAQIPMWIAQIILPVSFALIALRYVLLLGKHARVAVTGRVTPE